jgi:thymidylate synthase (FAD)
MKIVKPSYRIDYPATPADWERELKAIERAGRVSHQSCDKITADSYHTFIKALVKQGHEAVLEFGKLTVTFITDRGILAEFTRHRLASFLVESTRFVNYSAGKFGEEITVVKPSGIPDRDAVFDIWETAMLNAEHRYMALLKHVPAETARSVLPTCLKTEIAFSCNFREARHIFNLRALGTTGRPHPDFVALMLPLYQDCREHAPEVFDLGEARQ